MLLLPPFFEFYVMSKGGKKKATYFKDLFIYFWLCWVLVADAISWNSTCILHVVFSYLGFTVMLPMLVFNFFCIFMDILMRTWESCHKHFKPATIETSVFAQWIHTSSTLRAGIQIQGSLLNKCLVNMSWFRTE